jgi:uncharacterized protein YkwD
MVKQRLVLGLGLVLTLGACAQPAGVAPTGPQSAEPGFRVQQACTPPFLSGFVTYNRQIEDQLLDMLNEARGAANVPPLTRDDALHLRGAAREHAYDQSGSDSPGHVSTTGKTLADRLARWCIGYRRSGEFIGWMPESSYPAANFWKNWMDQPATRALLLSRRYTQVGIGVYHTQPPRKRYYATVILIAP